MSLGMAYVAYLSLQWNPIKIQSLIGPKTFGLISDCMALLVLALLVNVPYGHFWPYYQGSSKFMT